MLTVWSQNIRQLQEELARLRDMYRQEHAENESLRAELNALKEKRKEDGDDADETEQEIDELAKGKTKLRKKLRSEAKTEGRKLGVTQDMWAETSAAWAMVEDPNLFNFDEDDRLELTREESDQRNEDRAAALFLIGTLSHAVNSAVQRGEEEAVERVSHLQLWLRRDGTYSFR